MGVRWKGSTNDNGWYGYMAFKLRLEVDHLPTLVQGCFG